MASRRLSQAWLVLISCLLGQVSSYADLRSIPGSNLVKRAKANIARRNANQRVSFKECSLRPEERENCGHYGISEVECAARECCWGQTDQSGIPWCYHSKPAMSEMCVVKEDQRLACATSRVRKEQCLALDCCWKPSAGDSPWCFQIRRLPIWEGECGVPAIPPNVMSRIVNGVEARPHSWPWMASLQVWGSHNCGGSLINRQWIISAAHCYAGGSVVKLGLHSLSETDEAQISVNAAEFFLHDFVESPGDNYLANDIMLIKLEQPVNFTDSISPICLPEQDEKFPDGMHAYAAGWGATRGNPHYEMPETLQQVLLPLVARDLCNDWYNEMFLEEVGFHNYFAEDPIKETMQCAGYEEGGRSACYGDSGGPLVVYVGDRWVQVGATSWVGADICNMEKLPPVYTRVSSYIDWIGDTISRNT